MSKKCFSIRKICVFVSLFVAISFKSVSQTTEWAKCFGWNQSNDDYVSKIIHSKDGNYDFLINKALVSATPAVTITKTNQKGFILWETIIQSTQVNGFKGIDFVQMPDSTYFVLIQSPNTQQYCVNTARGVRYFNIPYIQFRGQQDFLLLKLNSKGEQLWYKFYGGEYGDEPKKLLKTANNQLIIGGNTYSNNGDLFGCVRRYGAVWSKDNWVFKTDTSGSILWKKCFGGGGQEELNDIFETQNGDLLITGKTNSNDSYLSPNRGGDDCYLIRADANGNELWAKTYGGSKNDEAQKVLSMPNGSVFLASTTLSNDFDLLNDLHSANYEDIWIAKLTSVGNIQFDRTYGGSFKEKISDLLVRNSNLVLIGSTGSTNGDVGVGFHPPAGTNFEALDDWTFEINSDGIIQWQKIMGGNNSEVVGAGLLTKDDFLIIGGRTNSNNNGDVTGYWGGTFADAWIYKLDIPCQDNYQSGETFSSNTTTVNVNEKIQFNGSIINNSKVKHYAGKSVELNVGTLISGNSTFEAKVLPCPSNTVNQNLKPIHTQVYQECREGGVKFKFEPFTQDSTIKKFLLSIEDNDSELPYTYTLSSFVAQNNSPNNNRQADFKVNISNDNYRFTQFNIGSSTCQHDSNPTNCPENNRELLIDKKSYLVNDIVNVTWTGTLQACSTQLNWYLTNMTLISSTNSTLKARIDGFPAKVQAQPASNYAGCYICHGWTALILNQ
jgi:hypothetical protein